MPKLRHAVWIFGLVALVCAGFDVRRASAQQTANARPTPYLATELLQTLARHSPRYEILLRSAQPSAAVEVLQRAGVLAIAGSQETCSGKRLKLIVTDYGERVAAQRGWSLQFGALVIPVGRLVPLGDTEVLDLHGNVSTLLMSFRFEGNSNVQYLQSLGNSSIWTIKALPNMHLTLADVDKTISAEIPIVHDGREGWIPLSGWSAETSLCG